MRKTVLFIPLLMVGLLAACADPDITGYVTSVSDVGHSITVVSKEPKDLSSNDGRSEFYEAFSLSNSPDEIEVGELVNIWIEGSVAESYPAQAKIGKLKHVEEKPKDTTLTHTEVLQEAIGSNGNLAVRNIKFNSESKEWIVDFIDIHNEKVWSVNVKDH